MHTATNQAIAVVIPSFKVTRHIQKVIAGIGPEISAIYVVDDCCPDRSGDFVRQHVTDARVRVLQNAQNLGVGGATMAGYRQAVADGFSVIVKIDGDGQMNPALIPNFIQPILNGQADYTKGNRFYNIEDVRAMPTIRLIGNAGLSFITKISTGYWNLFDPTNGYTAIDARLINWLPLEKISQRYFFESDLLFRLNTLSAVVRDIPMKAVYADEESNLKIGQTPIYSGLTYLSLLALCLWRLVRLGLFRHSAAVSLVAAAILFFMSYLFVGIACDLRYIYFGICSALFIAIYTSALQTSKKSTLEPTA